MPRALTPIFVLFVCFVVTNRVRALLVVVRVVTSIPRSFGLPNTQGPSNVPLPPGAARRRSRELARHHCLRLLTVLHLAGGDGFMANEEE